MLNDYLQNNSIEKMQALRANSGANPYLALRNDTDDLPSLPKQSILNFGTWNFSQQHHVFCRLNEKFRHKNIFCAPTNKNCRV